MEEKKISPEKIYCGTVMSCREMGMNSGTYLMRLNTGRKKFNAQPGQFISLKPAYIDCQMPRPFTVVMSEAYDVWVIFRVVGRNTAAYSKMGMGDNLEFYGPYGKEIFLDLKKPCVFVGGGIGGVALIAPFRKSLLENIEACVFLGAQNESQLVGSEFFKHSGSKKGDIKTITDDKGFVTDLLEEFLKKDGGVSQVIACGPGPMLLRIIDLCRQYGNEGQVIAEELMACGMGACKGCVIFGGENGAEVKHVCSDGPAFDVQWVNREKFQERYDRSSVIIGVGKRPLDATKKVDFTCQIGPLKLNYPFLNCSGTLDAEAILDGSVDVKCLGAFVTKGTSLYPKVGNPPPRIFETPSGMLNSIGLENPGIDRFIAERMPILRKLGIPIIVNVLGDSLEEYREIATRLADASGVSAIEVNISCPNVKKGGVAFGTDPHMAGSVTRAVKEKSKVPVIVKLSPNVTDITVIAQAVEDAGADAISLINTLIGMRINIRTRRPELANVIGGLSGPAISPVAIKMVYQVFRTVKIPLMGMGGIDDVKMGAEFMMAGATAFACGTGNFSNREIFGVDSLKKLGEIALENGFEKTSQLVGSILS